MDDAWHARCSSTWTTPPSVPPAPPLPPPVSPLPPLPPAPVPAMGSANQMDKNSQRFFHSFIAQENNLEDRPTIQEPLVFRTLNLDFAKSGKTELGNSFLALLSGHSRHLSGEFSQLSNSRSALSKLHVHNGGVVNGASRGVQVTSIPSLSENYGSDDLWNGEISSFVESRPFLMSTSTKAPAFHNSLKVAGSHCHGSGSAKPVSNQAFQGNSTGMGISSMSCGWPTVSSPVNTSQHHTLKIQASQKSPLVARSSVPGQASAFLRGHLRVFCMDRVGELFVDDKGLLGVLCFCHSLHMSMAKFCEHSGSPLVNPGEAIYLENGMTVARWRRLYFGNMAPDDGNGWEWPDGSSAEGGLVGSEGSNFPTLPKTPRTISSFQAVGGFGRSEELWNKSIYANHPYAGVGQTAVEKLANKNANNEYQRKSLEGHNLLFKSLTGLAQSDMPTVPKNNTVQAMKESPDCMGLEVSHSTLNKAEQNVWPSVVANNVNCMGNFGNSSTPYPYSGTKKSSSHERNISMDSSTPYPYSGTKKFSSHERNISMGNFSSEAFVVDRDVSSSNIDLRLGQPSQHNHTSVGSFPTTMHSLQFGAVCNSQKAQLNQPLTDRTDYPRETKKARPHLQYTPSEASSSNRGQLRHEVGTINALNHSEPKELTGDPTKNSLISLFLSHLDYGGNNSAQSTDIVNNSKHFMTRVLDVDSLSAKCNLLDHTSEVTAGIEKNSFLNGSNISNNIDKGKGPALVASNSCNIVKANYLLHNKHIADTRAFTPAIGGNCIHSSSCDDRQSSLHFNQPYSIMKNRPDARNTNQYGETPFLGNRDHCNHAIHSSINSVSYATARSGSLNSGNQASLTTPNSMYISEPTYALSHKRSIDQSQNFMDENLRFLALRHMVELPKQDQSNASLTTSPQQQRICCLSAMGLQRNVCKDDLVAPEEFRQGTQCSIQQNAAKLVTRSVHSCSDCYSGIDVEILSGKPGIAGPHGCCNCTALTQRISECSKEHDIRFSTCHVCGADEHPCLRFGKISNNSSSGSGKQEMCNQKARSPSFPGKCCCAVLSKCVRGCCFPGGDNPSDALNEQNVCGKDKMKHTNPAYDKDVMFQDGKRMRLGQCECVKKHVMKNDCQTGLWRDVPSKTRAHSDAPLTDKPAQVLEASQIVADQLTDAASKEFDGTQQVSELMNEQQMSNACSGSSAPAVTEVSVEVNNVDFCATNVEDAKIMHDCVVDEGSRIEKCGSSDEALGSRECEEAIIVKGKVDPAKSGCCLPSHSSGSLIDEHILESSSNKRRVRNQIHVEYTTQENINQTKQFERVWIVEKRKEPMKMNKLDASIPKSGFYPINSESPDCISHSELDLSSPKGIKASLQPENVMQKTCIFSCGSSSVKRKRSALSSTKHLALNRSENCHNICEYDKMRSVSDGHSTRTSTLPGEKAKQDLAVDWKKPFIRQKGNRVDAGKPPKYMSLSCIGKSHNHGMGTVDKKVRPVVCGKSGIISSGLGRQQKTAKIVSLSLILKKSKRCHITEYGGKPSLSSTSKTNKTRISVNNGCSNELSSSKSQCNNEDPSVVKRNGTDHSILLMSSKNKGYSSKNDGCVDEFSINICETDGGSNRMEKSGSHHEYFISQSQPSYKEIHRCSFSKLTGKDKYATKHLYLPSLGENKSSNPIEAINHLETPPSTDIGDALVGTEYHHTKLCSGKILKFALSTNVGPEINSQNSQDHGGEMCKINTRFSKGHKCQPFLLNSDAFCCVCGSSNQEDINYLIECNRCLIRVHQACYGVLKVPRGHWFCRPCKTNSQNIVCVLCGYGGGAMTRAVKSQNIVKSLLKAWKVGTVSKVGTISNSMKSLHSSDTIKNEFLKPGSVGEGSEYDKSGSVPGVGSTSSKVFQKSALDIALHIQASTVRLSDSLPNNFQVHNSIIAGVLDPSVTQWVHMVCGLWTPGTRCPNVDTMSAFDVSGASPARKITVCSVCNRSGGSCIECRVLTCSVQFHPWCAHQKGLLQSEIEGDDNEMVGFYGRCMLHATQNGFNVDSHSVDAVVVSPINKDWTCARTEGFKGRKREEGFKPNHWKPYNNGGGCIVSQEQINAWLHINGQKSCTRVVVKPPSSDVEYDFRKEYFRYKQSKGWKHLVVYKSGIHALGLYTSQFIDRGAMVVEYVGEIVGLRVADKREMEYQSGRRLQYKSACYFFRIDKEHIIDATRKGGIARFVNHSCLPNCVAKIISVRNEKKVVFSAERDINPGEEITYDYHFNHEDEGQKIPCFCNSKNCRRYLN